MVDTKKTDNVPTPLTPEQTKICFAVFNSSIAIKEFSESLEEDLKDGLSNSEKVELLLGAPTLIGAVASALTEGRKWRKYPSVERSRMLDYVAELIGDGVENAKSQVDLTFDFAAKMSKSVNSIIGATKAYSKAMKDARKKDATPETV